MLIRLKINFLNQDICKVKIMLNFRFFKIIFFIVYFFITFVMTVDTFKSNRKSLDDTPLSYFIKPNIIFVYLNARYSCNELCCLLQAIFTENNCLFVFFVSYIML